VTSRKLSANSNITEAIMVIDAIAAANSPKVAGCDGLLLDANIYQGCQEGPNTVVWKGIPIPPPNTQRVYRIANLRANANALPPSLIAETNITASVFLSSRDMPNFSQTIADVLFGPVRQSFDFSVQNATSVSSTTPTAAATGTLRFTELIPTAFKVRATGMPMFDPAATPPAQTVFPLSLNSESGFYIPGVAQGAGLADYGTRLAARFTNVPSGVKLYALGLNNTSGADPMSRAVAITSCDGPAVARPLQQNNYFEVPIVNGVGLACWAITSSNPNVMETFSFPIDMETPGIAAMVTAVPGVTGLLAPFPTLETYIQSPSSFNFPQGFSFLSDMGAPRLAAGYLDRLIPQALGEIRGTQTSFISSFRNVIQTASYDPLLRALNSRYPTGNTEFKSGNSRNTSLIVTPEATTTPTQNSDERRATQAWLTTTASSSTAPMNSKFVADPTGLAPGTYSGRVAVSGPGIPASSGAPITFTVPADGPRIKSLGYGIGNAGSYASNVIAPGEAVVIFGANFGPAQIVTLKLTNGTTADKILGGTRVLFDDTPAPLIYAVNGVVSCFVPFNVAGKKYVDVEVEHNGVKSPAVSVAVAAAVPGFLTADFSGGGQGSFLSVDYKFNGETGAAPGDFVLLFGTGAGELATPATDGGINAGGSLKATVRKVFIDGVEVIPDYFGPAPGQIEGIFQVNVKLPANVRRNANVPVIVQVGDYKSQPGVTIKVK
jgi:uncharacterized protein (TIGR03437 family)